MNEPLKPIHSEADYTIALGEVERLWGAASGTPAGYRLDVLATLIDAYEAEHHPMDPPDPIEAIKFRMEQQGLTPKDLEPIIGTRTRVAEVLNRKRGLSIDMIRRLHERLGAISVVDVPVNNQDPLQSVLLPRVVRGDRDIAEEAESHGAVVNGVVSGWAYG